MDGGEGSIRAERTNTVQKVPRDRLVLNMMLLPTRLGTEGWREWGGCTTAIGLCLSRAALVQISQGLLSPILYFPQNQDLWIRALSPAVQLPLSHRLVLLCPSGPRQGTPSCVDSQPKPKLHPTPYCDPAHDSLPILAQNSTLTQCQPWSWSQLFFRPVANPRLDLYLDSNLGPAHPCFWSWVRYIPVPFWLLYKASTYIIELDMYDSM